MNERKYSFSDYLSIILKWKKFFVIVLLVIGIVTAGITLLLPNKYKATTTFMIPASKDFGLGGLSSLLSGQSSALEIGTRLLGVTSTNEDMIMGFMKSKAVIDKIAKKYDLWTYYEVKDSIYEDLFRRFDNDLIIDANEYGFIDVSVINKNPDLASKISADFVKLADSLNVHFNLQQARNFREFVEKRYSETLVSLKTAEENYYQFQKEYGAYDIPEQVKALIEASSQMEAQLVQQELLLTGIQRKLGTISPQYVDQKNQLDELKKQLKKIYNGKSEDDFLISIHKIPELQLKYIRLYRDLEIQNKTLQFVYPIVEQARIDEQKNMPTILVIDKAYVPGKKYSPKRSFIVLGVGFFAFWIVIAMIFRGEKLLAIESPKNLVEEKERKFYLKLASIFNVPR
jgi:uncharacterized protein involved in exopolysaccharide biosynthesis